MKRTISALAILFTLTACQKTREQAKSPEPGPLLAITQSSATIKPFLAFAIANEKGTQLRNLGTSQTTELENAASYTNALCSEGPLLPLKYTGERKPAEDNTNRDTADNFEKMGGHYFQIVNGKTESDTVCLITDSSLYQGRKLLKTSSLWEQKLSADARARIEQAKKRKLDDSWGLSEIEGRGQLFLVRFARSGNEALAGIVLITPSKLVFLDFKGSYEDDTSVWRVSDGGELDHMMFDVFFVFETGKGIEFAYGWKAPEGESIELVRETGDVFVKLVDSYRYYF